MMLDKQAGGGMVRGELGTEPDSTMVNELRNYHVKKLLNHLGGKEVAPYLQKAIKRSFSEFTEDITKGQNNEQDEDRFNR